MNPAAIALLALAMSTDAFAAAIGKGAALARPSLGETLRSGLIFGVIETLTPLAGWWLGQAAAEYVTAWDHWIAFGLLCALGTRMIVGGLRTADATTTPRPARDSFRALAMTGFATSIDAMAVGVGLAFVDVDIVPVALAIGLTTFVMVSVGIMLGRILGALTGQRAEIAGGLVLIGIGAAILYEHLGAV